MDGKLLAQGLLNARGDELRLVYALLVETKMLQLLTSRVKDTFNKEVNHLTQDLDRIIAQLQHVSDEELQLKLFLHMLEQLEIRGAHFNVYAEIEHACTQIVDKAYALQMKQDKDFATYAAGRTEEQAVQLVLYQMQKIFAEFDQKIGDLSDDQTEAFVGQIEEYIVALPAEKQLQIKDKLDIDELTTKTLRQLVVSQGTVLVMTIVVEVAGFAAFTTLTSFMATAAGLIGITLPFGAYLFATSTLSILAGPVGIGLALMGGGMLMKYQSDKLRRTLIPIGVVQLLLPIIVSDVQETVNAEPFIAIWLPLYEKQLQLKATLTQYEQQYEALTEAKRQVQRQINEQFQKITATTNTLNASYSELVTKIELIPPASFSTTANELQAQMQSKLQQIQSQQELVSRNRRETGVFNTIKNGFLNYQLKNFIETNEAQYEQLELQLVKEIVQLQPTIIREQCLAIQELEQLLAETVAEKTARDSEKQQLQKQMDDSATIIQVTSKQLRTHQKQHYGLLHIE